VQRIEAVIGKKMELWPTDAEEVALLRERVAEASRAATAEMKEAAAGEGGARNRKRQRQQGGREDERDRDDDVVEAGMPRKKGKSRR
jgi:ATP-dependent RNA helicase DDX47/RRP3